MVQDVLQAHSLRARGVEFITSKVGRKASALKRGVYNLGGCRSGHRATSEFRLNWE